MARKILACVLAVALIALLGVTVASAPAASPDVESIEVTYYAKGGIPGPPDGKGNGDGDEAPVDNTYYELLGLELTHTATYRVNPNGAPTGAVGEIQDAFQTWDAVTADELFEYGDTTTVAGRSRDGQNTVSWVRIVPKSIVAMATIWYDPEPDGDGLYEIVEFDIIFNALQKWGIDPDDEGPEKLKRVYDVENVATHEAGHVVGLADLYEDEYRELTMYGYTSKGETIKITLEDGDIAGAQSLYGEPSS